VSIAWGDLESMVRNLSSAEHHGALTKVSIVTPASGRSHRPSNKVA
jgi:hypothetical protein